jgi:hypothetical protein
MAVESIEAGNTPCGLAGIVCSELGLSPSGLCDGIAMVL